MLRQSLLPVLLFCLTGSYSQKVMATAKFKTNVIRIGEQTELTLQVDYRKTQVKSVKFPFLKDTLIGKVDIVSKGEIEKYAPDKSDPSAIRQTQTYIITSFDSGFYAIPPFHFVINDDTASIVESEAMILTVNTVKADTTKAPKDIKPPLDEPFTFSDALPYIAIGLGAIAAIIGLVLLINRLNKRPIRIIPKTPPLPPHVIAWRKLDQLQLKKLWQEGKVKEYHSEVSEILREYIGNSFPVNALELTSDEILYRFRRINIEKELKSKLKQVLLLSDMVKFAKENPLEDEHKLSLANAYDFVRSTMPEEKKITATELKNDGVV